MSVTITRGTYCRPFNRHLKKRFGGFGISAFLNKNVEHNAVLIHSAPKIMLHALDPNEHLVQVPLVPRSWPSVAQAVGETLAEFLAPAPHGLIGDDKPTFSQKHLDIPQAEHMVQPDSTVYDLGRKAMAVFRVEWWLHAVTVVRLLPGCQTWLP